MRILILTLCMLIMHNFSYAQASFEEGQAAFYADKFQGKATASGEAYDDQIFTAAHRTHPFGTKLLVTNTSTGKSVIVRVNDRGPAVEGRLIDLSKAAAKHIGLLATGVAPVSVQLLDGSSVIEAPTTTAPVVTTAPTTTTTTTTAPVTETTTVISEPTVVTTSPEPTTSTVITSAPTVVTSTPVYNSGEAVPVINSKTIGANFGVQLNSFRDFNNVGIQVDKYRSMSFYDELKIYETWSKGKKLYKILVGPFATKSEAQGRLENLKNAHQLDAFIFSVK